MGRPPGSRRHRGRVMTGRLAIEIVGFGRMGRAVARAAAERGHRVVAVRTRQGLRTPEGAPLSAAPRPDVAIEFTCAESAPGLVEELLDARVPVVSGTTGCEAAMRDLAAVARRRGVGFLWAPNFALGVLVMFRLARTAAAVLGTRVDFSPYLVEHHHAGKRDAPSGTARRLAEIVLDRTPRLERAGPVPEEGPAPPDLLPVAWIRAGAVPGTHELGWEGPGESLVLRHVCRDRSVFARGAVAAAEWLRGQDGPRSADEMIEAWLEGRGEGGQR
ncbi:MAG: 4-hydroxy-tetrahydrodipicolinate reductase [Acidobacteria bacterium]|nr:MAG: 4-hydroxy-tetrahydrodipicolinate reductase [Acidobacteriota bacterium]